MFEHFRRWVSGWKRSSGPTSPLLRSMSDGEIEALIRTAVSVSPEVGSKLCRTGRATISVLNADGTVAFTVTLYSEKGERMYQPELFPEVGGSAGIRSGRLTLSVEPSGTSRSTSQKPRTTGMSGGFDA